MDLTWKIQSEINFGYNFPCLNPAQELHQKTKKWYLLLDSRHHYPRSHKIRTALTSHEKLPSEIDFGHTFPCSNPAQELHQKNKDNISGLKRGYFYSMVLILQNYFRQRIRRDNSACFLLSSSFNGSQQLQQDPTSLIFRHIGVYKVSTERWVCPSEKIASTPDLLIRSCFGFNLWSASLTIAC